jgi:hypothetical protein
MRPRHFLACLWLLATGVHAQTLKPGLWEVTLQSTSESGLIEKSMESVRKSIEKLSPQQRRAYEAKMAQNATQFNAGNMTRKMCLNAEMAAKNAAVPHAGEIDKNGCTVADVSRQANTIRASFFCPYDEVHGERRVEFDSMNRHIVRDVNTMYLPMTTNGKSDLITAVSSLKFISSDCGDIKPAKE